MRNKSFLLDIRQIKDIKIEYKPIQIKDYEDIDCDRLAIVGKLGDNDPEVININASQNYIKESPLHYVSELSSTKEGSNHYVSVELLDTLKYLPITYGKITKKMGQYTKIVNRQKVDPIRVIHLPNVDVIVYNLDIIRYDTEKNDHFWEFIVQNEDLDTFYVNKNIDVSVDVICNRIRESFKNTNYKNIRQSLYRYITKNKTNGYKGYVKMSDIPKSARHAYANLAELLKVLNEKADKPYGYSVGAVFLGWVSYCNSVKFSNSIIKETIGIDREYFMKSLKLFEEEFKII